MNQLSPARAQEEAEISAPSAARREAGGAFVAVLAFAGIAVSVMQTLVVPLLTELPRLLHTTTSNASWVVTATLLAGAVATPIMGRLGDMFGKRKIMIAALSLLVAGSLICAVTSDVAVMVVGRAVQGGAIGAIPLGISIMRDELPPKKLGSAMALMSSSLGIGGALGLPAAALVAQHTDWHVLFYAAAAIGALAIALIAKAVPESSVRAPGRFDVVGAVGLSAGLVALLLPITKGGDWGWADPMTLGMFGAAAVILLAWGCYEVRTDRPLVDLRTTARRQVLLTNLASILVGFSFYAMSLVLPQLLQLPTATGYGLGQSMVVAGLCVAPMGVAMMLVSPLSARINATRGPKVSLMTGLVVIGAGYGGGLVMLDAVWQVVVIATAIGAGVGIAYSAMPTLIIGAVPPSETGSANGLNTLMRSIGTSASAAVAGVILAHNTTPLGPLDLPDMAGFRTTFAAACAAAVLGLAVAFFLPGRQRSAPPAAPQPQDAPGTPAPEVLSDSPAPGRVLRGRVLGPDGAALADAAVTLIDSAGRQLGRALSELDGGYTLHAPDADTFVLIASAAAHQPRALTVQASDGSLDRDLVLSRGPGVSGSVRSADGEALGGAAVSAIGPDGEVLASAVSDAKGAFALPDLAPGTYAVTVAAPGHRPHTSQVRVTEGSFIRVNVELRPVRRVRGTVRDRAGRPVADARVSLLDAAGDVVDRTVTGEDGRYAFHDLTADHYTLVTAGYAPLATPVTAPAAPAATPHVDVLLTHQDGTHDPR